ncbi:hypothetical protein BH24CHL4_BH24CHL4_01120 [soil metagenome]
MVLNRFSRCFSLVINAVVLASLMGPVSTGAQEGQTGGGVMLQQASLIVDASLRADPSHESTELEFLVAGSTVTLMAEPVVSAFDAALWVQAATLTSVGYLPSDTLPASAALPSEEAPAGLPVVIRWDMIRDPNLVPCRIEPHADAQVIIELVSGQDIGLTAEPVVEWQPVLCDETQGFVPVSAFIAPPVDEPAVTDPTEVPTAEIPPVEAPTATEAPPASTEETGTPTADATPAPTPGTDPSAMLVEVAALPVGNAIVSGTDGDGVRCRSAASLSALTIIVLAEGVSVTVRGGQVGSFQQVFCAGQDGFVWAQYLASGSQPGGSSSGSSFGQVQNTDGDGLRCRAAAGLDSAVITVLSPGSTVSVRGAAQGSWQPVTCSNQNGWVHTDFFSTSSGAPGTGNSGSVSHGFVAGQNARISGTDGDGLRFRASASYSGAMISVLSEGTGVVVRSGSSGVWVAVSYGGSNGFVHMDYLTRSTGSSTPPWGNPTSSALAIGSNAKVTEALRLRSGASFSSSTLDIAPAGMVARITGTRSNGFYPVRWDDLIGYMHGDYLTWTSAGLSNRPVGSTTPTGNAGNGAGSASGQAVVNYAMRYLGYPYVWGARGPSSFDCAGFTYWVAMNVLGQNIGGGVIAQWSAGTPVQYGNLRPGDMVYFHNTYTTGLSHNGIYIGNNQFIHASNPTTGVIVSNITNSYYAPRYFGARRLV